MSEPIAFDSRLHRTAVEFILPTGPRVDMAVMLAEDLVGAGFAGEATLDVAALSRDAALSDAEPLLLRMLAEHGIEVPDAQDDEAEYMALLVAFGYWDLPIHFFEGPFYVQILTVEDREELDGDLVQLLDQRDHATTPDEKHSIEEKMRAVVRAYVDAS